MKVTRGHSSSFTRPYPVATIGNFDGHHIGHRTLLRTVVEAARRMQGTALALTFDPHPVRILAPHADLRFLTSSEEKLARFEEAGLDEVVFLEFSEAFARLTPEEFVDQVLHRGLQLRQVFVGQHFAFGHKRMGTIADLVTLGQRFGLEVCPVPPVMLDGAVVSSTRIRRLIQQGKVEQAATLLGRQYGVESEVLPGAHRGQSLGWPTANLRIPADRVIPPDGVYATVTVWNRQRFDSVAYVGTRPTFDSGERLLEVYLLDVQRDLYGESIAVQFVERIRDDIQFASGEALSRQISLDVERARTLLRRHENTAVGR
jgi:riboflavin kinase/FMN adenylyltransferase